MAAAKLLVAALPSESEDGGDSEISDKPPPLVDSFSDEESIPPEASDEASDPTGDLDDVLKRTPPKVVHTEDKHGPSKYFFMVIFCMVIFGYAFSFQTLYTNSLESLSELESLARPTYVMR